MQFQKIAWSLRLHQLPAGVMPVLAGMAYARWKTGAFDFVPAVTVLLLTALTQLGGMCLDDYFDHHSGVDAKVTNRTLFSGGSDLIQTGVLKAQTMLLLGIATLGLALLLAFGLTAVKGNWVLVGIYVFGIFSGIFYTAPPFAAAYRGWGEILIAANYGPTAAELGYAAQTGTFNISLLLVSLVFSGLILAANLVHEMLDYEADRAAGKKGWVVLLGLEKSKKLFSALLICPYLLLILSVTLKMLPFAALLPLGTAAWLLGPLKKIGKAKEQEELFSVLSSSFYIYVLFGLALTVGLILGSLI